MDLPTPEPAKSPMRWPCTNGSSVSNTATPVLILGPSLRRDAAGGAAARKGRAWGPRSSGRPSSGWPKGSMMRPIQLSSGARSFIPSSRTSSPTRIPSAEPSVSTVAMPGARCRISPPRPAPIRTRSPRPATLPSPATCTVPRPTSTTRPITVATGTVLISAKSESKTVVIFSHFVPCLPFLKESLLSLGEAGRFRCGELREKPGCSKRSH